jgi:hypothetical protein
MFIPISNWFPAFVLTAAIEAPIVGVALHGVGSSAAATAVVFLFANLATHLAIWYVGPQLLIPGSPQFAVAAEGWAVSGEALLFWAAIPALTARRAMVSALTANFASFAAGLLIGSVWPDGLFV